MLIRPHDDGGEDDDRWRAFVAAQGFGHFVAGGRGREVPVVVPTQFVLDHEQARFHVAAPNPVLSALAEHDRAILSVAGDWAYVPGAWKAIDDEDPRRGIPTTYYAAVQLIGRAVVSADPDDIAATLRRQLADVEPDGDLVDPAEHGASLRLIRAITLDISEVRAKFKYGGNVDAPHRQRIADELRARNQPGDAGALAHLRTD